MLSFVSPCSIGIVSSNITKMGREHNLKALLQNKQRLEDSNELLPFHNLQTNEVIHDFLVTVEAVSKLTGERWVCHFVS